MDFGSCLRAGAHLESNVGGELCMSHPLLHPTVASRTDALEG